MYVRWGTGEGGRRGHEKDKAHWTTEVSRTGKLSVPCTALFVDSNTELTSHSEKRKEERRDFAANYAFAGAPPVFKCLKSALKDACALDAMVLRHTIRM